MWQKDEETLTHLPYLTHVHNVHLASVCLNVSSSASRATEISSLSSFVPPFAFTTRVILLHFGTSDRKTLSLTPFQCNTHRVCITQQSHLKTMNTGRTWPRMQNSLRRSKLVPPYERTWKKIQNLCWWLLPQRNLLRVDCLSRRVVPFSQSPRVEKAAKLPLTAWQWQVSFSKLVHRLFYCSILVSIIEIRFKMSTNQKDTIRYLAAIQFVFDSSAQTHLAAHPVKIYRQSARK